MARERFYLHHLIATSTPEIFSLSRWGVNLEPEVTPRDAATPFYGLRDNEIQIYSTTENQYVHDTLLSESVGNENRRLG
jgi:hypothetical protein